MFRGLALVSLVGCFPFENRIPVDGEPCELAEARAICPACLTGEPRCAYEEFETQQPDCGVCGSVATILRDACDAGVEEVSGDIVCHCASRTACGQ